MCAKWCPAEKRNVIYQYCEDCEEKICRTGSSIQEPPKLLIYSEREALFYAEDATRPSVIISIRTTSEKDMCFAKNPEIKGILHMKFNDLIQDTPYKGYVYKAPVQKDMNGLKEFVDKAFAMGVSNIVVHCAAGVSRSAAVAQAISDYKNLGHTFWNDGIHIPNHLVYRLCMREFGIQ